MKHSPELSSPVAIVEDLYRLFGEGRLEETFDLMSEDVRLFEPGDDRIIPWAGEFRGHEGLRCFYRALGDALSEIEIVAESLRFLRVGEERVLALGTERGVVAGTGKAYVTDSAWLWETRDGRITRLAAYHDTAAMAEALSEG